MWYEAGPWLYILPYFIRDNVPSGLLETEERRMQEIVTSRGQTAVTHVREMQNKTKPTDRMGL